MNMCKSSSKILAPLIVLSFMSVSASFAATPFTAHKMTGPVQQRINDISREIQCAFDAGLINGYEMAQFQRDLDGIRMEDNYFRTDSVSIPNNKTVMRKLSLLEEMLDSHAASNLTWEVATIQK